MAFMTATDWNAIKWYASNFSYTVKDMVEGPMIVFRDTSNNKVKVNLHDIKMKYNKYKKDKSKNKLKESA